MTRYTVRVNDLVYEALVDDPPSPRCRICGHALCPCCAAVGVVSCDEVVPSADGEAEMCACTDTDDGCRVDSEAFALYRTEIQRRQKLACFGGNGACFSFEGAQTV
jgi:hypothetical protein